MRLLALKLFVILSGLPEALTESVTLLPATAICEAGGVAMLGAVAGAMVTRRENTGTEPPAASHVVPPLFETHRVFPIVQPGRLPASSWSEAVDCHRKPEFNGVVEAEATIQYVEFGTSPCGTAGL